MNLKNTALTWSACALWLCAPLTSPAQPVTPSAQEMIEQLKSPSSGPRLRGLRNLTVEPISAAPVSSEATPSSSTATSAASSTASSAATPSAAVTQPSTPSPSMTAPAVPAAKPALSLLIQFDFNSAQVRQESQQALMNLAMALKANELIDSHFAVEGHTDAKGLPQYNLKLSQQRAEVVQAFLVKQGVAAQRLTATGKGATQLANSASSMSAENRRVRIVNLD